MPQRNALGALLAVAVLGLVTSTALAQTPHLAQPGHPSRSNDKPPVVVQIKNGPRIRGRLVQTDKDSIQLEVDGKSCSITLEAEEVASIDFAVTNVAQKAPERTSLQATSEVRETP